MNERIKELMKQTVVPLSMPFDKWCEKFAALVAAHEREECAKLCDEQISELYASRDTVDCADYLAGQIRARGTT